MESSKSFASCAAATAIKPSTNNMSVILILAWTVRCILKYYLWLFIIFITNAKYTSSKNKNRWFCSCFTLIVNGMCQRFVLNGNQCVHIKRILKCWRDFSLTFESLGIENIHICMHNVKRLGTVVKNGYTHTHTLKRLHTAKNCTCIHRFAVVMRLVAASA